MKISRKTCMLKKLVLFTFLFSLAMFTTSSVFPAEYYVSSSDTNSNDNGPGTEVQPWATLSKVQEYDNNPGFQAGDYILLRRGDTWNESLVIQSSGITISSYGPATDPLPIIDGEGTRLYGVKITSSHVTVDGVAFRNQKYIYKNDASDYCNNESESGSVLIMGSGRLYDYFVREDSKEDICVYIIDNVQPVSDIILSNLTVDNTESNGIYIMDANDVTVSDCTVSNIVDVDGDERAGAGIIFDSVHNSTIRYCYVDEVYRTGVLMSGADWWGLAYCVNELGLRNEDLCANDDDCTNPLFPTCDPVRYYWQKPSNNNTIEYNNVTRSSGGIFAGGNDNIIQYNNTFGNYEHNPAFSNISGIWTMWGSRIIIRYNVSYNNIQSNLDKFEGCGIFLDWGSNDTLCYGNIIFSNDGAGIALRYSKDIKVFNNIIYNNSQKAVNDAFGGIVLAQPSKLEVNNDSLDGEIFNNILLGDQTAEVRWLVPQKGELVGDHDPQYPTNPIKLHHNYYYCDPYDPNQPDEPILCVEEKRFVVVAVGILHANGNQHKNFVYHNFEEWKALLRTLDNDCNIINPDYPECLQEVYSDYINPELRNPPNQQFQLTSNSPCINAGYIPTNITLIDDCNFLLAPEELMHQFDNYAREFLSLNLSNQNDHGSGWEMGAYIFCQGDSDCDEILDIADNCPLVDNEDQSDTDGDCIGDACDEFPASYDDGDQDGIGNGCDNCPEITNPIQYDTDEDDLGDVCDNCPEVSNPNQIDTSPPQGNGIGDACDCECDFTCNGTVDAEDVTMFLWDFGRGEFNNPCTNTHQCFGDTDCNGAVDADDVTMFLEDFGRSQYNNPCPVCEVGDWCVYP